MGTMKLIASSTVGSGGVAEIIFGSIPTTYTDLLLKLSIRSEGTSTTAVLLRLNGSTTNALAKGIEGNASAVSSWSDTQSYAGNIVPSTYTANTFCNNEIYIPNYNASTNHPSSVDTVTENAANTFALTGLIANLWSNATPVTSITLARNGSNNFAQHSTAYLYGISNA